MRTFKNFILVESAEVDALYDAFHERKWKDFLQIFVRICEERHQYTVNFVIPQLRKMPWGGYYRLTGYDRMPTSSVGWANVLYRLKAHDYQRAGINVGEFSKSDEERLKEIVDSLPKVRALNIAFPDLWTSYHDKVPYFMTDDVHRIAYAIDNYANTLAQF